MKDAKNNNFEITRKVWDEIVAYEKSWMKTHAQCAVPTQKLIEYFGTQCICEMYGCTVATDTIARELIIEAFK